MAGEDLEADVAAIARIAAVPTILEVVCRTTGMGFAAVARVTEDRWVACSVRDEIEFGLEPGGELKVETTICHEIRESRDPVVIDRVAEDDVYCSHPTAAMYGFQSYIPMPILLPDGTFFGTLCAIDPRPARLRTPETIGMFKLFAELIAFHIDAGQRLASSEASLVGERQTAELREQFIAVLGHDLRNPLASIGAGMRTLQRMPLDEKGTDILVLVQNSIGRMSGLIDNVLDFARGRLGGGLTLDRDTRRPLKPVLEQVVAELRAAWPDRIIDTHLAVSDPIDCDRTRIAQLLSNLLGNALTYGAPDKPVRVIAHNGGGGFELSVLNAGEPIPAAALDRLFSPFARVSFGPTSKASGLASISRPKSPARTAERWWPIHRLPRRGLRSRCLWVSAPTEARPYAAL